MTKLNAAFFCLNEDTIDYVYGEQGVAKIAELTNLSDTVINPENIKSANLEEIDVIFSTWGMFVPAEEEMARLKNLKAVFYAAGATDGFCREFRAKNVHVISAWQANSIPVAEFCVAQIVLGLKSFFNVTRDLKNPSLWNHKSVGPGCYGETVALIGAGAIAGHVAKLLENYHLKTLIVPSRKEKRTISLEEAFATSQVVSNHLPNRDDNVGVLNGKLFASMRPNAVFINTGRGRQVNEPELIDVLKKRPDLTALLDVTFPEPPVEGSELYTLPNVYLTPHIAGSLHDEVHRMADYMIGEFESFLAGKPFKYEVDESMLLTSN